MCRSHLGCHFFPEVFPDAPSNSVLGAPLLWPYNPLNVSNVALIAYLSVTFQWVGAMLVPPHCQPLAPSLAQKASSTNFMTWIRSEPSVGDLGGALGGVRGFSILLYQLLLTRPGRPQGLPLLAWLWLSCIQRWGWG